MLYNSYSGYEGHHVFATVRLKVGWLKCLSVCSCVRVSPFTLHDIKCSCLRSILRRCVYEGHHVSLGGHRN